MLPGMSGGLQQQQQLQQLQQNQQQQNPNSNPSGHQQQLENLNDNRRIQTSVNPSSSTLTTAITSNVQDISTIVRTLYNNENTNQRNDINNTSLLTATSSESMSSSSNTTNDFLTNSNASATGVGSLKKPTIAVRTNLSETATSSLNSSHGVNSTGLVMGIIPGIKRSHLTNSINTMANSSKYPTAGGSKILKTSHATTVTTPILFKPIQSSTTYKKSKCSDCQMKSISSGGRITMCKKCFANLNSNKTTVINMASYIETLCTTPQNGIFYTGAAEQIYDFIRDIYKKYRYALCDINNNLYQTQMMKALKAYKKYVFKYKYIRIQIQIYYYNNNF